jgi:hypothetical protein
MNSTFLSRFPKQLGHWAIHGSAHSSPCFVIALFFLHFSKNAQAVMAMLLAIGIYVLSLAIITSLAPPLADASSLPAKALKLGVAIRSWIAGLSLLLLPAGYPDGTVAFYFMPDIWCGFVAVVLQSGACIMLQMDTCAVIVGSGVNMKFIPVFTAALLTGLFLTILLLMISFFCLIILQARERRRFVRSLSKPGIR